jgi:hypothetical protein
MTILILTVAVAFPFLLFLAAWHRRPDSLISNRIYAWRWAYIILLTPTLFYLVIVLSHFSSIKPMINTMFHTIGSGNSPIYLLLITLAGQALAWLLYLGQVAMYLFTGKR